MDNRKKNISYAMKLSMHLLLVAALLAYQFFSQTAHHVLVSAHSFAGDFHGVIALSSEVLEMEEEEDLRRDFSFFHPAIQYTAELFSYSLIECFSTDRRIAREQKYLQLQINSPPFSQFV